jgi:hypothetical protein
VVAARVRVVSFLSLAAAVPDGTVVARVIVGDGPSAPRADVVAGRDTAEWSYDVPGAARPAHARAKVGGHWPGNPRANLYWSDLELTGPAAAGPTAALRVDYLAPEGRLHLRSAALVGSGGTPVATAVGPAGWGAEEQAAFFTRFAFSFLNAPVVALLCALLVPLGVALGYRQTAAVALALGTGAGTMLWPYARYDFAEPLAALCMVAATLLAYTAAGRSGAGRFRLLLLVASGACAGLAAAAKYSAAWFVPLLAVQVGLMALGAEGRRGMNATGHDWRSPTRGLPSAPRGWRLSGGGAQRGAGFARRSLRAFAPGIVALGVFLAPSLLAFAATVAATGRVPTIWTGWSSGLAGGWLDFPLWAGIYGLLFSPGKGLFLYVPALLLSIAGAVAFLRRHRTGAVLFLAVPATYVLFYGSKGVWHGGGWGPRYLVPAVPFLACLALPVVERLVAAEAPRRAARAARAAAAALVALSVGVQLLGVAKHPNQYTVMFRDHVAPALPEYGRAYGGAAATAYWRHFGGPEAHRQLHRPPGVADGATPERGLGYLYAEDGPLEARLTVRTGVPFDLTLYACDWDHRGRRQRITLRTGSGTQAHTLDYDFSRCEYLTWTVSPGAEWGPLDLRVDGLGGDVPVLSAIFFDPAGTAGSGGAAGTGAALGGAAGAVGTGASQGGPLRRWSDGMPWHRLYGRDGYALLAWRRGTDVAALPPYVAGMAGGDRVWVDTWQNELAETPLLYAPGFSPLAAHAWLLAADAISVAAPGNEGLLRRVLGAPPWRYVHGLDVHPDRPEFGLGLDFWPVLVRTHFRSQGDVMAWVWLATGLLWLGVVAAALALLRVAKDRSDIVGTRAVTETPLLPRAAAETATVT